MSQKISEMIQRTPDGTEYLEVIIPPFTPGTNRKVLLQDILDAAGGGTVTSVSGTTNRITSTGGTTPVIDLSSVYTVDRATPSTAGGTITLDMNSQIQRMHVGSASFATPKTIAMSNTTNSLLFNFFFEVTDVAAVLTVPADWIMSDTQFDGTAWAPPETGKYELGGSLDGTNWWVKIQGPFS